MNKVITAHVLLSADHPSAPNDESPIHPQCPFSLDLL